MPGGAPEGHGSLNFLSFGLLLDERSKNRSAWREMTTGLHLRVAPCGGCLERAETRAGREVPMRTGAL
jgi:hypothetical protein